jgi:outer membrane protein assembly factor BamB
VWSPIDGAVRLRVEGTGEKKVWFNGSAVKIPGQWDPSPTVQLKKGWNNLVVKVNSTKGAWNFVAHMAPMPPYEYEIKNIQWMTRMPGQSWCSPIIVGDKIFVSADDATVLCLSKADGKMLWMRSTTYYHAITAEERAQFADLEPKVQQLDAACEALPAAINADIDNSGAKADRDEALKNKIKAKRELEGGINQAMAKVDKKKYDAWGNDQDWSKYTPTSDGKYVYAVLAGGNKGIGANVVTCFDLDGKRIWSYFAGQTNISEHGTHSSPALCGNILVVKTGEQLIGLEKLTGKVAWQVKAGGGLGASVVPVHIGKDVLAYVPQAGIFQPADGAQVWKAPIKSGTPTPTIVDGVIYGMGQEGNNNDQQYFADKLPAGVSNPLGVTSIVKASWKNWGLHMPGPFSDSLIGSPLYDNGLVYIVTEGGALNVLEAQTGKRVYAQILDNLNPRLTWVFVVGICSSPTLGGKYIFVRDDQAQTLVIEPGTKYKELAKNRLVELSPEGTQAESQSNFFCEGTRIYFRTRDFMYCLGEK